jgi:hypothetical protein
MPTIPRGPKKPKPTPEPTYSYEQMKSFGWIPDAGLVRRGGAIPRTPDPRIPYGVDTRFPPGADPRFPGALDPRFTQKDELP